MNKCTNCGSHAGNPHMHGRGGDSLDLCDVCYWRAKVVRLEEALRFVLDECNWEESANEGGGDNRIGPVIRRALEEK